ncbi:MAG: TIGR00730 family Rossman fold protein [Planctomycetota bacterium]|nr:TIGR00730 family Rossman fold protein [Planctomycetota bacterium]
MSDQSEQNRIDDLIVRIRRSAERLVADRVDRGDLKILSRTLRELRYAFKVFAPYRNQRKVSVFGSARTSADAPTYRACVQFGAAMAQHDWMVVTGAAQGIMEAGHVGAGREMSMGLNIMLPFEQEPNPVIADDHKLVNMKYFFTRKLMFVKECDAVVCYPGGFGTLDEALEVLTLIQTGKRDLVPVIFADAPGGNFWKTLDHFIREHLLLDGMISPNDLHLYSITDDYQAAAKEIMDYYRMFHSMRYVGRHLVLRLNGELSESLLNEINSDFADLLNGGDFQQHQGKLDDEKEDPQTDHLTRLIFHFKRRDHGRLRQLVNMINEQGTPTVKE